MNFSLLAVLLLALGLCNADFVYQSGVSVTGNVTFSGGFDNRFRYRATEAASFGTIFAFKNMDVTSSSSSSSGSGSQSANVSGIVGLGYSGLYVYPSVYVCYFQAAESITYSGNAAGVDASLSAALVGKVFSNLQEVDSTGKIVQDYSLKGALLGLSWSATSLKVVDQSTGLQTITFTTTSIGTATVAITFAFSSAVAKITGGATMTPTAVETYFEVNGYTLANSANHLRLVLYTGYLTADATVSGTTSITAGSGETQISIRFSGQATVNGNSQAVTVTGLSDTTATTNDIPDAAFQGQLKGHGSLVAEVRKVAVDFPAGAGSFTYDPAIGFGAPNSSSFLAPSLFLICLASLLALFF